MAEKLEAANSWGSNRNRGDKRRSFRLLSWWMRWATYSLPVPLAPLMSTDILVGETSFT